MATKRRTVRLIGAVLLEEADHQEATGLPEEEEEDLQDEDLPVQAFQEEEDQAVALQAEEAIPLADKDNQLHLSIPIEIDSPNRLYARLWSIPFILIERLSYPKFQNGTETMKNFFSGLTRLIIYHEGVIKSTTNSAR